MKTRQFTYAVLLILVTVHFGHAQIFGTIRGTVVDPQGAAIPGASVTLKAHAGGSSTARPETSPAASPSAKKKLSYLEAREFATLDGRIAEAEQQLQLKRAELEDPSIASDGPRLLTASAEVQQAQKAVDALYARWFELEEKQNKIG